MFQDQEQAGQGQREPSGDGSGEPSPEGRRKAPDPSIRKLKQTDRCSRRKEEGDVPGPYRLEHGAEIRHVKTWYKGKSCWTPVLHTRDGVVDLRTPRQDFSIQRPDSAGFFCTGKQRLGRPQPGEEGSEGEDLGKVPRDEPVRTSKKRRESTYPCPKSSPWILNTTYFSLEGELIKLRWGPNYVSTLKGIYVDISVGPFVIWTTDRHMRLELDRRERQAERYVIENQRLELRTMAQDSPPEADQVPIRWGAPNAKQEISTPSATLWPGRH